jgi:hypothetical protein
VFNVAIDDAFAITDERLVKVVTFESRLVTDALSVKTGSMKYLLNNCIEFSVKSAKSSPAIMYNNIILIIIQC